MQRDRLPSLLLTLSAALVLLPLIGFAQVTERMIEKASSRNEPVRFLKIKTKNKEIELGKKFGMDDDWLLGLTVTVQNASDQPIARIDLRLTFPRPGGGTSPETALYMADMSYGRDPADVSPNEGVKLILPGESVDIKLPEVNVPFYKQDLEKLGYEQPIKHVQLKVRSVTFVDGSEWDGGVILYPNPNNPKEKINPRLPTDIQTPKESKSPPSQSMNFDLSPRFRFLDTRAASRDELPAYRNKSQPTGDHLMKRNRLPVLLLMLIGALVLLPRIGFAQESERMIERVPWRTEPIKILKLKTKNNEVEAGKKFSEADDWLVGLTVTVQNTSNKPIARIELRLGFPPPKGSSPEKPTIVDGMIWGREPATAPQSEELKLILPGESVEIRLLESNLRWMKEDVEKLGYGKTIKHAQMWIRSVTFVDGSEWRGDEILYPNPNNPKEKINPIRPIPG